MMIQQQEEVIVNIPPPPPSSSRHYDHYNYYHYSRRHYCNNVGRTTRSRNGWWLRKAVVVVVVVVCVVVCILPLVVEGNSKSNSSRSRSSHDDDDDDDDEWVPSQMKVVPAGPPAWMELKERKIVLFVAHFFVGTDVNQLLEIANELCGIRGHECHFIVMEPYRKRVQEKDYVASVKGTPNILTGEDFTIVQQAFQFTLQDTHWMTYIQKYVATVLPLAAKYYEPSLLIIEEFMQEQQILRNNPLWKPDLMIISKASESAADYAWEHNIPLSVLFSGPLGSMAHAYEDVMVAPDSNLWGSKQDVVYVWSRIRKGLARALALSHPQAMAAAIQLIQVRYQHGFHDIFTFPGGHWSKAVILSTWSLGLDIARPLRPLTFMLGFLSQPYHPNPNKPFTPQEIQHLQYLHSKPDGVVFCAFGSLVVLTQEWFDQIVYGMDQWVQQQQQQTTTTNTPTTPTAGAIIAVNALSYQAGLDVSNVPSTVLVTDWLNQKMVLAHPNTVAFITHGGLASLGESIEAQVPMLVIPIFLDQPNNAHRVQEAGIGLKLHFREEPLTANAIATKLQIITTTPTNDNDNKDNDNNDNSLSSFQKALRKQYIISKRSGGVQRAADILEQFLLLDGNFDHLIPITEQVPFYVKYHIDLFLLFLFLMTMIMYGFWKCLGQHLYHRVVSASSNSSSSNSSSTTTTTICRDGVCQIKKND